MKTEEDLAKHVVAWLERQHWEVYQEVTLGGGRADIVGVQYATDWIIESKLQLGLGVIAQAVHQRKYAYYVSVAVPYPRRMSDERIFAMDICKNYGIGVITVGYLGRILVQREPDLHRWAKRNRYRARNCVKEGHKTHAKAGSQSGGQWTPYKQTIENVRELLKERGELTMVQIVEALDHHYAHSRSARSHLPEHMMSHEKGFKWRRDEKGKLFFSLEAE